MVGEKKSLLLGGQVLNGGVRRRFLASARAMSSGGNIRISPSLTCEAYLTHQSCRRPFFELAEHRIALSGLLYTSSAESVTLPLDAARSSQSASHSCTAAQRSSLGHARKKVDPD